LIKILSLVREVDWNGRVLDSYGKRWKAKDPAGDAKGLKNLAKWKASIL
jgi:hypothetical protein